MSEKEQLYQYCRQYVLQRMERIRAEINNAQQSANEETKSSAGDKYETGRAMAQLEIERNQTQLRETEKLSIALGKISPTTAANTVQPGALVSTSTGIFYIAISLGQISLNNKDYLIVSSDSPVAKAMLGKQAGNYFTWKGIVHIEHVQ